MNSFKDLQSVENQKIKKEICDIHGEYESKNFYNDNWSTCPKCQDIKFKKHDEDERKKMIEEQKQISIENALKSSMIPERFKSCTLENYTTELPGQQKALDMSKNYITNYQEIKKTGSSMFYCGTYGTGKTHLAIAILAHLIKSHTTKGIYITTMRMLRDIRRSYNDRDLSEQYLIDKYINTPLLVLDEVGVQMGTDAEKLLIYEVINGRYENYRSTIILSNLSFSELKKYMGERAIDRLKSKKGSMVVMDWESWRAK